MSKEINTYEFITSKINALKEKYPSLRACTDDYVFSAVCVKAHFYKKADHDLNEGDFGEIIVDGSGDGGADILLNAPDSEESDLVIAQSKFYKTISQETVLNAMLKMARFYKDMNTGHFGRFNSRVQSRFLALDSECSDESKIHFVFYTSAPKKKSIDTEYIERNFREQFDDSREIEVSMLFADDIVEEIHEAEAKQSTVERGNIRIDDPNNYLLYGDYDAVIVNVSAVSIAKLYAAHGKILLALNLRYYIKGKGKNNEKKVDDDIKSTIKNNSTSFWFKNNGLTITCDDFDISGNIVKLRNFSIVNGGQTTYLLYESNIDDAQDFYLPCKIIRNIGDTEEEKINFSSKIAEATNSQKAINAADLLANTPEQIRFKNAMRSIGLLYQTKRGEEISEKYHAVYLHTKLFEVGKLCLAAIFQEPCKSRSNPKMAYKDPKYYNPIFNGNQVQVAQICKELLYIDDYFNKKFRPKFNRDNTINADRRQLISNARTICVAFAALAARYHQGNINDQTLNIIFAVAQSDSATDELYKAIRDLGDMQSLLPIKLYTDSYDAALNKLFSAIINAGVITYSIERRHQPNLAPSNYLKKDRNYYSILSDHWATLQFEIQKTFADV